MHPLHDSNDNVKIVTVLKTDFLYRCNSVFLLFRFWGEIWPGCVFTEILNDTCRLHCQCCIWQIRTHFLHLSRCASLFQNNPSSKAYGGSSVTAIMTRCNPVNSVFKLRHVLWLLLHRVKISTNATPCGAETWYKRS